MFDIASSELLLLGLIALVVVGPKDLPKLMRTVGRIINQARAMAGQFRMGLDQMIREAEMAERTEKAKAASAAPSTQPTAPDQAAPVITTDNAGASVEPAPETDKVDPPAAKTAPPPSAQEQA